MVNFHSLFLVVKLLNVLSGRFTSKYIQIDTKTSEKPTAMAGMKSSQKDGLVSLFNGISTLLKLFYAKAILLEEQLWYYLTYSWEDKGVHMFPKGICPKVNAIARLEYELAYYDSAVHRFNHYTTRTPSFSKRLKL